MSVPTPAGVREVDMPRALSREGGALALDWLAVAVEDRLRPWDSQACALTLAQSHAIDGG